MKGSSLRQKLALVEDIFMGRLTRLELESRSKRERVFVGTAIVWLLRDTCLDDEHKVLGPGGEYGRLVSRFIQARNFQDYPRGSATRFIGSSDVSSIALSLELYDTGTNPTSKDRIALRFPEQLTTLVDRLGRTPAIETFLQEVANQYGNDMRYMLPWLPVERQPEVDRVVDVVFADHGLAGLVRLQNEAARRWRKLA